MGKLFINSEGFVDLRKNPPASTTVTVQGFTPPVETPRKLAVEMMPEPPATLREEPLPAIQKNAEGLQQSVAGPVKVPAMEAVHFKDGTVRYRKPKGPPKLERLYASDGIPCYVIVSSNQFRRVSRHKWTGTKQGYLYRKIKSFAGEDVLWLHRVLAHCNRIDQFVGFSDNDERNCTQKNLLTFNSKDELKAHKLKGRRNG